MSAFGFNVKDSIQLDLAHVVKNLYAAIVNVGQISEVDFRVFGHTLSSYIQSYTIAFSFGFNNGAQLTLLYLILLLEKDVVPIMILK